MAADEQRESSGRRSRAAQDTGDQAQQASQDAAKASEAAWSESAGAQGASELQHSQGGTTTRQDANDLGVPMLQGDPSEPVGPEDALGVGPKRGDYSDRIVGLPHQAVPIPMDQRVAMGPTSILEDQRPRAEDQGEEAGEKGGVTTG